MASKKSLLRPSKIEDSIQTLNRRGLNLRDFVGGGVAGFAFIALGLGVFAGMAAGLGALAPDIAKSVPLCRGNPVLTAVGSALLVAGSIAVLFLSRAAATHILALDDRFVVTYRSGKVREIFWHEIEAWYESPLATTLVRLRSGRLIVLPASMTPAWAQFRLLLSLPELFGASLLSPEAPSLGKALSTYKTNILGPGVTFEGDRDRHCEGVERKLVIYAIGAAASVALAFAGLLGPAGPLLGVTGLVIALFVDLFALRDRTPRDTVFLKKDRLTVTTAGSPPETLMLADLQSWSYEEGDIRVKIAGASRRSPIAMGHRSSRLLLESILIAKALGPPRVIAPAAQTPIPGAQQVA